jgi:thymidylate synthase (FAD)
MDTDDVESMSSDMGVDYIDHMGTDLTVVNAARVSFDNESKELNDKDRKLIRYLAQHEHWSPFAHPQISLRVKAPIFVARQLAKHQVGFAWNEVSRRYVDTFAEIYLPNKWRKRAEDIKQGSDDDEVDVSAFSFIKNGRVLTEMSSPYHLNKDIHNNLYWKEYPDIKPEEEITPAKYAVQELLYTLEEMYENLLELGVCPEQARMILPQATYTEWIWTGSLLAYSRMCKLRLDSHTQRETQEVAQMISDIIQPLFTVSWECLNE